MLALDNPLNDPESDLMRVLSLSDIIFTSFFALEAIMKIISFGFLFNGKSSYLRNGWNLIDFIVVVISIISMLITSVNLKIIKIFRLLRVLRPLRVISRNKELKIGI
jgi:voltage-dependent calcium channel L type alpha-1D